MNNALAEALRDVKEHDGEVKIDNFVITYDENMETDNPANFGPWSIDGDTINIPDSGIAVLSTVLDEIQRIEQKS